jgi:hypothetical protein
MHQLDMQKTEQVGGGIAVPMYSAIPPLSLQSPYTCPVAPTKGIPLPWR